MNNNYKKKASILDNNNLLKISAEAFHFQTQGELILDLKNEDLKWNLRGAKSDLFNQKYNGKDSIPTIKKSDIKKVSKTDMEKDNRILLRIELKNENTCYIFSFYGDNKIVGNKIIELLQNDYFDFYKTEFKLLPIEHQKRICLLLNNKFLSSLYKKLYACSSDVDFIWNFIKSRYPQLLNISLGKNRIQLSRDEELIMFAQKKYNITKLINSDNNISKSYLTKSNIKSDKFWDDFINTQRGSNGTYLVGGYKPVICHSENDNIEEVKNSIFNTIFEDLEKDKYYYDCYETNYLYHNDKMKKEQDNLKEKIKLLNDYSMNKMKNVNYFSYHSLCIYNKKIMKNKNIKRLSESNLSYINGERNEDKMDIEENIQNNNSKNRLSKAELLNRISNMKNEFENGKNGKKSKSAFDTMKAINDENYKFYNLMKFDTNRFANNNLIYIAINYVFIIKDLLFALKCERHAYLKSRKLDESSPQKMHFKKKFDKYTKEIKNNYEILKNKINQTNNPENLQQALEFLLDNVKNAIGKGDMNN